MNSLIKFTIITFLFFFGHVSISVLGQNAAPSLVFQNTSIDTVKIKLPNPSLKGTMTIEEALAKRRSIREYKDTLLTLEEVSQILWSAYGITDTVKRSGKELHTAPSAMAIYPLTIYLVAGKVKDLPAGIYQYVPKDHYLILHKSGDFRNDLSTTSNSADMIKNAPVDLVYSTDTVIVNKAFGEKNGMILSGIGLGHSAENVYLQSTALGMGTCFVGGFNAGKVSAVINMPANEKTGCIMPLGKLKD